MELQTGEVEIDRKISLLRKWPRSLTRIWTSSQTQRSHLGGAGLPHCSHRVLWEPSHSWSAKLRQLRGPPQAYTTCPRQYRWIYSLLLLCILQNQVWVYQSFTMDFQYFPPKLWLVCSGEIHMNQVVDKIEICPWISMTHTLSLSLRAFSALQHFKLMGQLDWKEF